VALDDDRYCTEQRRRTEQTMREYEAWKRGIDLRAGVADTVSGQ
jgi:hypothetical protein